MKGSLKFGLIVFVILMVVIAIVDLTSKKPIIWDRTYDINDKNPFGLYVTRQELPRMLGANTKVVDIKEDIFTELDKQKLTGNSTDQYLFIDRDFDYGNPINDKLFKLVNQGAKVFIAAENIDIHLLDTLKLDYAYFYGYKHNTDIEGEIKVELTQDHLAIPFNKSNLDYSFTKLPANAKILGGLRYKDHLLPNFVEVKIGKGSFFIHLQPELFANYYLLNRQNQYQYVARAFSYFDKTTVKWYDFTAKKAESQTPLRVLLAHQGLRQAWYILLVSLILFLVFKSRREQRAVKTVLPEPNLSKQFCETIGTLYYENGSPENMVHKKVDYFLHDIRKKYHVDTLTINEEEFVDDLAGRSGLDKDFVMSVVRLVIHTQKRQHFTEKDLRNINNKIEEFKLKAKM